MIHILFLILKIIGIMLLVILGLIVLTVTIVHVVPVQYQIKAETTDGIDGLMIHAKAHWFFNLIYAYFDYRNKETTWQVRIGWKKLNTKRKKKRRKKANQVKLSEEQKTETKHTEEKAEQKAEKKNWFQKIKCTIVDIYDKIKKMLEAKGRWVDFVTDETHLIAFKRIKDEVFLLAKHMGPRDIQGYIRFGLEDPYRTGQVLAALSILYPFYGEQLQIYPEFEKEILEGNIQVKGRVSVTRFLLFIYRIYADKDIKKAYGNFKLLKS